MLLVCSTGKLLAQAAFMYHDHNRHSALKDHAGLTRLSHFHVLLKHSLDSILRSLYFFNMKIN